MSQRSKCQVVGCLDCITNIKSTFLAWAVVAGIFNIWMASDLTTLWLQGCVSDVCHILEVALQSFARVGRVRTFRNVRL